MKNKQLLIVALAILSSVLFLGSARAENLNESKKGFFTIAKNFCGKMISNNPTPTVIGTGLLVVDGIEMVTGIGKDFGYTFSIASIEDTTSKKKYGLKNRTLGGILLGYAFYQNIKR